jgi:hypothetical protein
MNFSEREREPNKKEMHVYGVALFTPASQMYFTFDLHNRMKRFFSKLVNHFSS